MALSPSSSQRLSEVVRALRFPLILIVVFIHVPLAGDAGMVLPWQIPADGRAWYDYVSQLVSFVLGDVAVPMFFLFSGYYMFARPKAWWTGAVYREEMTKRIRTLVLPYVIWCTLSLLADQGMLLLKGEPSPWASWGEASSRLLYAYVWGPENYPLWYLRDLIILSFLAPLIDWLCRRAPWVALVLFGVLTLDVWPLVIPAGRSVLYVLLGAIFGSRQLDLVALARRGRAWIVPLFLVASLLRPFVPAGFWLLPLQVLYVPLAIAALFVFGGWTYERAPRLHRLNLRLEPYVFFVYVAHEVLVLSFVKGIFYRHGWLETVGGYFLCGALVTGLCLIGYGVLARVARRPLAIALGGRL